MDIVQPPAANGAPHPLYLGIDARARGLLSLEQQSHEVEGNLDLKRTGATGQLAEFLDRFREAVGGLGSEWFFVWHHRTIDKSR